MGRAGPKKVHRHRGGEIESTGGLDSSLHAVAVLRPTAKVLRGRDSIGVHSREFAALLLSPWFYEAKDSPTQADHLDLLVIFALVTLDGMQRFEPFVGIAILAAPPDGADELRQVVIRRTTPQHGLQVMSSFRKEAGDQLPVRCEPDASAA